MHVHALEEHIRFIKVYQSHHQFYSSIKNGVQVLIFFKQQCVEQLQCLWIKKKKNTKYISENRFLKMIRKVEKLTQWSLIKIQQN